MSDFVDSAQVRVMIVDDHELFRQGVSSFLKRSGDINVVAEVENGLLALQQCKEQVPDVILMDINMPVLDGLEATRRIKQQYPHIRILILTVSEAEEMLFEAVKAGASGYVLKNARPSVVLESVRRVHAGEPVVPENLAMRIITEFSKPNQNSLSGQIDQLTEREVEVLRHLSTGASNRDIALALYISENTIRNHVRNILEKLHLANRVQAAAYAVREGFVIEPDKEKN